MLLVSMPCNNGVDRVSNGAIGIDDDIQRRDSLHAIINNLPDPHYATLRALVLVCPGKKSNWNFRLDVSY
jgi:hypothetical protein